MIVQYQCTKVLIICFLSMTIFMSCQKIDYDLTPLKYEQLETFDSGYDIITEGANPKDNLIFSSCNTFTYEYTVEKNGVKLLGQYKEEQKNNPFTNWDFIKYDDKGTQTYIEKFILYTPVETKETVSPNQSLIKVLWVNSDNSLLMDSNEGIIENHENIWMHPLRSYHMWPTFTAPWPYIDYPLEIGKKYKWWKKLDGGWGSDKYVQWDKIIHFDYEYEVTGTDILTVNNKTIECYIIDASGLSEIGKTKVTFFFNPTIGFVRYDYTLMDDSSITMYLVDFELDCQFEPDKPSF